jgi:hypothetical protein
MGRNVSYKDIDDREIRGRAMIRDGLCPRKVCEYPEVWVVPSGDRSRAHSVAILEGRYNCTCEDYRFHGGILECKHICAVKEYENRRMPSRTMPIKVPPVSARRDNVIYIDGSKGNEIVIKIVS